MKTKISFLIIFFSILLFSIQLSGCGSKSEKPNIFTKESINNDVSLETPPMESTDETSAGYTDKNTETAYHQKNKDEEQNSPPAEQEKIPQKIIKTAEISFQIEKYNTARTKILEIIKKHSGYVSSENQTGDEYRTTNVMVIRIGSSNFDALIDELLKDAVFVDYKKINAEDVTEEFVDINARLKSKKNALLQYETILKKAYSINEILNVQQYIRSLQEEIESMEGRLKYLNNKVELSTITATFYEQGNIIPVQKESFGYKIREALSWGWQGLLAFFVGIIYLWPLWLILGITLFILIHFVKKARKKRARKLQQ